MTTRISIGPLADLPNHSGHRIDHGEVRIAVFRFDDDVYAIGDRCSHAEASLAEGEVFDLDVECPRHGSEFSLETGEPGTLPATGPVPVYEVEIDNGEVFVTVAERSDG